MTPNGWAFLYFAIGVALLWPLWWEGDVDNPAGVVLLWPVFLFMVAVAWVDDRRHAHRIRKAHAAYNREAQRRRHL